MALIKCSECGRNVSDRADKCPNCGNPIQRDFVLDSDNKPKRKYGLYALLLLLLIGGGYYVYTHFTIGVLSALGDEKKDISLSPQLIEALKDYQSVKEFSDGLAAVKNKEGKWGYINSKGEEVIPCKFELEDEKWESVDRFQDGLAKIHKGGKWSLINRQGETVVPFVYDYIEDYSDGLAAVRNGQSLYGYIDKSGKEVIPCKYEGAHFCDEGMASVCRKGFWGFIDKKGNEVIECVYDEVGRFQNGLVLAKMNGKSFLLDKQGKEVLSLYYNLHYDEVGELSEGLIPVAKDELWGVIDTKGKEIVPCKYKYVSSFSEGLAVVSQAESSDADRALCGYINTKGELVIPCKFDNAESFHNGLAKIGLSNSFDEDSDGEIFLYGYIDTQGKEVIPCKYSEGTDFNEGIAKVSLNEVAYYPDNGDVEILANEVVGLVDWFGHSTITKEDFARIDKAKRELKTKLNQRQDESGTFDSDFETSGSNDYKSNGNYDAKDIAKLAQLNSQITKYRELFYEYYPEYTRLMNQSGTTLTDPYLYDNIKGALSEWLKYVWDAEELAGKMGDKELEAMYKRDRVKLQNAKYKLIMQH